MSRERKLLEAFYFRAEPLGVTLFGPEYSRPLSFGQSATRLVPYLGITAGLMQKHLSNVGLSVFFARLDGEEALVAQFPFRELDLPLHVSWLRFVRLATALALSLDPGPSPEPPFPGSAVQRPQGPPSWLRTAHAEPELESGDEPA
jgi:hypothetical protein